MAITIRIVRCTCLPVNADWPEFGLGWHGEERIDSWTQCVLPAFPMQSGAAGFRGSARCNEIITPGGSAEPPASYAG